MFFFEIAYKSLKFRLGNLGGWLRPSRVCASCRSARFVRLPPAFNSHGRQVPLARFTSSTAAPTFLGFADYCHTPDQTTASEGSDCGTSFLDTTLLGTSLPWDAGTEMPPLP